MITSKKIDSKFNITKFWKSQETVVLYHGTSADKLDSILENGLVPHDGLTYLTPSPMQAESYAEMGGENEYLQQHKALVAQGSRIVIEVEVETKNLNLNGSPNFQTEDAFNKVKDMVVEFFEDDKNGLLLEFTTSEIIRPENIVNVYRR